MFIQAICVSVRKAEKLVLPTLPLHYYLRQTAIAYFASVGFANLESGDSVFQVGEWLNNIECNANSSMADVRPIRGSRYCTELY